MIHCEDRVGDQCALINEAAGFTIRAPEDRVCNACTAVGRSTPEGAAVRRQFLDSVLLKVKGKNIADFPRNVQTAMLTKHMTVAEASERLCSPGGTSLDRATAQVVAEVLGVSNPKSIEDWGYVREWARHNRCAFRRFAQRLKPDHFLKLMGVLSRV